jgi:hypothetical protein
VSYIFTGMLGIKLLAELASALFLACMDTRTLGRLGLVATGGPSLQPAGQSVGGSFGFAVR